MVRVPLQLCFRSFALLSHVSGPRRHKRMSLEDMELDPQQLEERQAAQVASSMQSESAVVSADARKSGSTGTQSAGL